MDQEKRAAAEIAEAVVERRKIFERIGATVASAAAVAAVGGIALAPDQAKATDSVLAGQDTIVPGSAVPSTQTDLNIINFALNLEFLDSNYYSFSTLGQSLSANDLAGGPLVNGVYSVPGAQPLSAGAGVVPFATTIVAQIADFLAADERAHVEFIKATLTASGANPVPAPLLDLSTSPNGAFNTVAMQANALAGSQVIPTPFNPYANENNFLLGGFIFEDTAVTAYAGSAGLLSMGSELVQYASSLEAIEAYHAAALRTLLILRGYGAQTDAIANLRSSLAVGATYPNAGFDDAGTFDFATGAVILAPRDATALAFRRNTEQVLNIAYGNFGVGRTPGLFYPNGFNELAGQTGFA